MKNWLITGASSGLGRGIARAALAHGDRVAVTARDARKFDALKKTYGERVLPLSLEVTDAAQRRAAAEKTLAAFGSIDVLANNAGRGQFGAVEDTPEKDIRLLFETNFFGPVGMIRAALPAMREAGEGLIINTSSMGVMFEHATGNAYYVASKAALEMLSEVLASEVRPFGIDVMILEPGAFRTEFRVAAIATPEAENAAYRETAGKTSKYLREHTHNQPGDPEKAGEAIYAAATADEKPHVLILGKHMIETAETKLTHRIEEIRKWRTLAESTDFVI